MPNTSFKAFSPNSPSVAINHQESSFDIQEIQGDKNHAKAITQRNGKAHELIIFAFTEEDFEKLQDIDDSTNSISID